MHDLISNFIEFSAKTISNIIPELKDKIDGVAIRVPTPNVSLLDLSLAYSQMLLP